MANSNIYHIEFFSTTISINYQGICIHYKFDTILSCKYIYASHRTFYENCCTVYKLFCPQYLTVQGHCNFQGRNCILNSDMIMPIHVSPITMVKCLNDEYVLTVHQNNVQYIFLYAVIVKFSDKHT